MGSLKGDIKGLWKVGNEHINTVDITVYRGTVTLQYVNIQFLLF